MRQFHEAIARGPHPAAQAMIDRAAASNEPPLEQLSPAEARKVSDTRVANAPLPKQDMAAVEEIAIPGPAGLLKLRVYRPIERRDTPFVMFFHGGGFMLGTLDTHDALCRALAKRSGMAVIAVGFRLAPEDPFPAASDDCLAATRWAIAHAYDLDLDPTRFALAGESSGGNLAAGVALRLRNDGDPAPRLQALLYPLVDMTLDHQSYRAFAEGYLLTKARMEYYLRQYIGSNDRTNPIASPLRDPRPALTPPTFLLTAGLDPTVGPALDYADRLKAAGVAVEAIDFPGWTHGFLFWGNEDGALAAIDIAGDALARALAA